MSSFYFLIREAKGRWKRAFAAIASFLVCFVGMYLNLFLLTTPDLWPDWGKIRTFGDLFDIVILRDFASFQAAVQQLFSKSEGGTNALAVFFEDYWKAFNVVGIFPIFGLPFLWRKANRLLFWAFSFSLIMMICFLALAEFPGPRSLVSESYVERYSIPLVLLLAILSGFGAMWIRDLVSRKFIRLIGDLFLVVPLLLIYFGREKATPLEK